MNHYKEPLHIHITASPDELRKLADRMEQYAECAKIGGTTFVDLLAHGPEYLVSLHFDQERTKGSMNYREPSLPAAKLEP